MDLYIRMLKNKKKKSRISPSVTTTICALVILIGGFFLSYNYIQAKKIMAYDYMANVFYTSNTNNIIVDDGTRNNEEETVEEEVTDEYIGYLNIPKINLTKGFYSKNSKENDIAKNILEGKEGFRDKYILFLKSGGRDYPLEVLKIIDVDLKDTKVFEDAMSMFKETLERFSELSKN